MATTTTSNDEFLRSVLRFALGVSVSFVLAQLADYPLAHVLPVFVGILLMEPRPLPVQVAGQAVLSTVVSLFLGLFIATLLLPYPLIFIAVFSLLLFRLYFFLLVSGAHFFAVIGILFGCLVMPVLAKVHPEIASGVALAVLIDVVLAVVISWVAFLVLRPVGTKKPTPAKALPHSTAYPLAIRFTLVAMPLFAAFLAFEWANILTLVFGVLYATSMNSRGGATKGAEAMVANLVLGGLTVFVFYEILVMVPLLPMMAVLLFTISFFYGTRIFSGGKNAHIWWSGMSAMLFLAGPALLSEDVTITGDLVNRVSQILLAALYIILAYSILDMLQHFYSVIKNWVQGAIAQG
jgi:uncharacterized membrane protein YccC